MSGVHSAIAPSSLYLTVACPGSLMLIAGTPPEPDTPESIEGNVGHWVALQTAMGIDVPVGTERDGIKVDEDMLDGARLWAKTIGDGGAHEAPIWIPDVHNDCWGTADHWKWNEATNLLKVSDYKYGHVYVEEYRNEQMVAYASGIIRALNIPDNATVELTIVQPRYWNAAHVRTWTTTAGTIRRIVSEIADIVRTATNTSAPVMCITGPHCLYCPARGRCDALQRMSNTVMAFAQQADSHDLQPGPLAVELQLIDEATKLLEGRRSALAIRAEAYIKEGKRVPNWEMKPGRSNLTWIDPQKAIIEGDAAGVNIRKPIEPITPTQAIDRNLLSEDKVKGKVVDGVEVPGLAFKPTPKQSLKYVSQLSISKILSGECS